VFYGWVGVYIVSPIAVGWLWLRNARTDPGAAEPGDPAVPDGARRSARVLGGGGDRRGLLVLVAPAVAIDVSPWALTPLTARVIACFTIQVGLGAMLLSADVRWSSWRLLLQTFLVATALLLAARRAPGTTSRARARGCSQAASRGRRRPRSRYTPGWVDGRRRRLVQRQAPRFTLAGRRYRLGRRQLRERLSVKGTRTDATVPRAVFDVAGHIVLAG
jgi:hypothetical protein